MKSFIFGVVLLCLVAGVAIGYKFVSVNTKTTPTTSTTTQTTTSACTSLRREERRIIDQYTFLLSREEIRQEEDRRAIEREFHDKFFAIAQEGEKKGCPVG